MKDSFGREITYLRLSVTDLCNLRCRYCMPEEGVCKKQHEEMLTEDEMIAAVSAAASLGIRKVRITGGEPLIKKNIVSICERVAAVEGIEEVCLTTNGILLPERASSLRKAGVKRVNISLDTLDEEKYRYITRTGNLKEAMKGIVAALVSGFEKVKINAVLIGGFNDDEIRRLAELTLQYPVDVRFIELMPMTGKADFGSEAYINAEEVLKALPEAVAVKRTSLDENVQGDFFPEILDDENRRLTEKSEEGTAELYQLPGALGRIGLIHPVSNHFCERCNRIRITADGKIKPCLHSDVEINLKGLSEEEMTEALRTAILEKPKWHGELSYENRSRSLRDMNQIGG